jgi:hypothetical protein
MDGGIGQWEQWVDRLRFQPARHATVAQQNGKVVTLRTVTIPPYTATDEQVEEIRSESLARYGIPYAEAKRNVQETGVGYQEKPSSQIDVSAGEEVPAYEVVFGQGR